MNTHTITVSTDRGMLVITCGTCGAELGGIGMVKASMNALRAIEHRHLAETTAGDPEPVDVDPTCRCGHHRSKHPYDVCIVEEGDLWADDCLSFEPAS